MEKNTSKRHIAFIERCVMSRVGLCHLFNNFAKKSYEIHVVKDHVSFEQASKRVPFFAVIYSFSAIRGRERRQGLECLDRWAKVYPSVKRILLADDDKEARLIGYLSPAPLHGVISKSTAVEILLNSIIKILNETGYINEYITDHKYLSQHRLLSPTEREILRYMSCGYSIPEIAVRLARNIKTIRAHKFNVMTKLGVNSDVGLLNAADILVHMRPG